MAPCNNIAIKRSHEFPNVQLCEAWLPYDLQRSATVRRRPPAIDESQAPRRSRSVSIYDL